MPWIGTVGLNQLHRGTLQPWVQHRRKQGVSNGTINHCLKILRRILNLAASEWMDEHGLTWLAAAPKIKLLPDHLAQMALFAVNTGCRDSEICGLRWEWEVSVPQLETSVFVIPGERVKNGDERLVVLNRIAKSVVDSRRGIDDTYVFTFRDRRVQRMLNTGWQRARNKAGLPQVRVHDLKHTFGRRLRAAGVSFEDRQDLLGHRSGRMDHALLRCRALKAAGGRKSGPRTEWKPAGIVGAEKVECGLKSGPHAKFTQGQLTCR